MLVLSSRVCSLHYHFLTFKPGFLAECQKRLSKDAAKRKSRDEEAAKKEIDEENAELGDLEKLEMKADPSMGVHGSVTMGTMAVGQINFDCAVHHGHLFIDMHRLHSSLLCP